MDKKERPSVGSALFRNGKQQTKVEEDSESEEARQRLTVCMREKSPDAPVSGGGKREQDEGKVLISVPSPKTGGLGDENCTPRADDIKGVGRWRRVWRNSSSRMSLVDELSSLSIMRSS